MNGTTVTFAGRGLVCAGVAVCWLLLVVVAPSQQAQPANSPAGAKASKPGGATASDGRQIFASHCAACHGLDGRGGERAPDIATSAKTQGRTDEQILEMVEKGIPGTGMPRFASLGSGGTNSVVAYLRTLQGRTAVAALPGDAVKGRAAFYGKARCAECHMVSGAGGFIAGDLTAYAASKSVEDLREAIVKPTNNGRLGSHVVVTTRDGRKYPGLVRNEDNFSVQLQTLDGAFHFFDKVELRGFERLAQPLMPTDYGATLSVEELNDTVSFLMSAARQAKNAEPKKPAHGDDEEYDDD
jgi:cytochrome c oxidase cbb3-type subunit 3